MGKKKFEKNKWIKFQIDDITFVGRTILTNNNEKIVAVIDALGTCGHIVWADIEKRATNLSKLTFIPTKKEENFLNTHVPNFIIGEKEEPKVEEMLFFGTTIGEA